MQPDNESPPRDEARVIGTDERVRLIVRLAKHALVILPGGTAAWLPSARVSPSIAECRALLAGAPYRTATIH